MKWLINKFILCNNCGTLGIWAVPDKVIYTDNLNEGVGGNCSYGLFSTTIRIRPKYKSDMGILNHEATHSKQFGRLFWAHSILAKFSTKYRLLIEIQAYREQVKIYKYTKVSEYNWIVDALFLKYNLNMSRAAIKEYLDYAFIDVLDKYKG